MKVLVCEDEEMVLEDLILRIEKNLKELMADETVKVQGFSSIFSLYDYLDGRKEIVDAIFLDIKLNDVSGEDGICVAEKIQKEYKFIKIIFCTGYVEYKESIFRVNPVYCLYKPITDDRLIMVLNKLIIELKEQENKFIVVKSGKKLYKIMSEDISYAEIDGEHVSIHTHTATISATESLDHIEEMLGRYFVRCHKSYIVNLKKMVKFEPTKLLLIDGTEITVSRRYRSDTRKAIINMMD